MISINNDISDNDSENDIDFYKLDDQIELNLDRIWYNIILPYLELEDDMKILQLKDDSLIEFKLFFYKNSKYYKFVQNNLYN